MSEETPPRELVVDAKPAPGDQGDSSGTAMLPFVVPAIVSGALAKYVSPAAGLAGLALGVVVLLVLRKPREGRFVLRVEGGVLEVARERRDELVARVPIDEVLDVTLDRQTQAGARGGASKERVHLALERRAPADPIFVPEERITPIEGQEWLGKVRVFLRKHGWVPEDERGEATP